MPSQRGSSHLGMSGLLLSPLQEQLLKRAFVCNNCPDSWANPCRSVPVFPFPRAISSLDWRARPWLPDLGRLRSSQNDTTLNMSLATATGNAWKKTRWICEQCLGLLSQQDACRAIILSVVSIQPVLENSEFEAALADCTSSAIMEYGWE